MHDAKRSEAECIKNNFELIMSPASGFIYKQANHIQ